MTQVLFSPGIGKQGKIRLGCSAAVFDGRDRILLTRRVDNGQWCLPGGGVEPGETVAEACESETEILARWLDRRRRRRAS